MQTAPILIEVRPGRTAEHNAVAGAVVRALDETDLRLRHPLTGPRRAIARVNLWATRRRGRPDTPCLAPGAVDAANRSFSRRFGGGLVGQVERVLEDPQGVLDDVERHEALPGGRPELPFHTETGSYSLIVRDPLRVREEHFLTRAVLGAEGLGAARGFSAVDLGTGSGRLAISLAHMLHRAGVEGFEVHGLDVNAANVADAVAAKVEDGLGDEVRFALGDMVRTPYPSGRFDLCNVSSATYLVPAYERAFHLAEVVRVLREGGEGVLTGPNERFTPYGYACCMAATNLGTYLANPLNLLRAQRLGPIGLLIEAMADNRTDFALPRTDDLCAALEALGCEVRLVEHWGTPELYSGIVFSPTPCTHRRLATYRGWTGARIARDGVRGF